MNNLHGFSLTANGIALVGNTANVVLDGSGATDGFALPIGNTIQRIPGPGVIRYNIDLGEYEGYQYGSNTWSGLGGGSLIIQNNNVLVNSSSNLNFLPGPNITFNIQYAGNGVINIGIDSISNATAAYNQANAAYNQANLAYTAANGASANSSAGAYNQANLAYAQANLAYTAANSAIIIGEAAYAEANLASTEANSAISNAASAYTEANLAYTQANTAYTTARNSYDTANAAYTQANNAYTTANSGIANAAIANTNALAAYARANLSILAITTANSSNLVIGGNTTNVTIDTNLSTSGTVNVTPAYNQANAAYAQANLAYAAANLAVISITAANGSNLVIGGNTTNVTIDTKITGGGGGSGGTDLSNTWFLPTPAAIIASTSSNWSGYSLWVGISGNAVMIPLSTIRFSFYVTSGTADITTAVLNRYYSSNGNIVTSTPVTWNGSATPSLTVGSNESDLLSVPLDQDHDIFVIIYFASTANNSAVNLNNLNAPSYSALNGNYASGNSVATYASSAPPSNGTRLISIYKFRGHI